MIEGGQLITEAKAAAGAAATGVASSVISDVEIRVEVEKLTQRAAARGAVDIAPGVDHDAGDWYGAGSPRVSVHHPRRPVRSPTETPAVSPPPRDP